jgi:hypothetical protein
MVGGVAVGHKGHIGGRPPSKLPGCSKHPKSRKLKECKPCQNKYERERYNGIASVSRAARTRARRRKNAAMGETYLWMPKDEEDAIARCEARGWVCYCGCGRVVRFDVPIKHPDAANLDRIDNTRGYLPDNVEFLRADCNTFKNANTPTTLARFYNMIMNHKGE